MSPAPIAISSSSSPLTKSDLKRVNKLSDKQAWSLLDDVIRAAAMSSWTSYIYAHFNVFVERRVDEYGEQTLWFRFECKNDPILHTQYRARKDTSSGTHNLIRGADACQLACNAAQSSLASTEEVREFSLARLRTLIALWCTRNHRPFELFRDDLFAAIVHELRPGTTIPDPSTISRDVRSIYINNKESICRYFQQIDHIHLAMDGWTVPTSRSYLGVVAIWQHSGQLHRAILEFVMLTKRHSGEYLAQQTAECLNKYDLGPKLLTVCMDNANNNNTFTLELQKRFPTFGGPSFRGRCSAHIVNLMAKAYLSIFSKPANRKRSTQGNGAFQAPSKRCRLVNNPTDVASTESPGEYDAGNDSDSEGEDGPADDIDEDKSEYNNATVKASVIAAFSEVEKNFGLVISQSDRQTAQQLLPKISGLASRAKRSPLVQQKFEHYVAATPGLSSSCSPHPALPCGVATRWNTELTCIRGHVQKRPAVKLLTADRDLSLKRY
ncbi:unnamed protein product [Rhizoctonia solani]|uniref:AC transposase n=1 Tax=Rhizoctonia solani TaxID=456999 RepID=A0A8H2WFD4_9AGAM|nr:unnamed protein product [Rhizoctonia solani]